jgi:ATP-dependent DNA ligase
MLPKLVHPRCDAKLLPTYWTSSQWSAERKYDGSRVYIYYNEGKVTTIMRSGIDRTLAFNPKYYPELEGTILDAELFHAESFGKTISLILDSQTRNSDDLQLAVFDVPFYRGEDLRRKELNFRRTMIHAALGMAHDDRMFKVPVHRGDLGLLYNEEVSAGREGIVLKKDNCGYGVNWVKAKAFRDTSVIVLGPAPDSGEQAYRIGLWGTDKLVQVGTVKLFGEPLLNRLLHRSAEVVDIRALSFDRTTYSFRQPFLLRERPDVLPSTCTLEKSFKDFS